jgi:hypothetical protein
MAPAFSWRAVFIMTWERSSVLFFQGRARRRAGQICLAESQFFLLSAADGRRRHKNYDGQAGFVPGVGAARALFPRPAPESVKINKNNACLVTIQVAIL